MGKKVKIGLVFGGKSGEHEVSIRSAEAIYEYLDKTKYEVEKIKIKKDGSFDMNKVINCDKVFSIVHGTFGEDGCLQGMLEMLDKPYIGAGVLGSAIGMDKDVQKRLLMQAGIPVAKFKVIRIQDYREKEIQVKKFPVFVKPANLGSSVGVSKCKSKSKLKKAIEKAFEYDTKVLIEEYIEGREIEVAGLDGKASLPGEIIPKGKHEFYDYEAKYIDENGAELRIPAELTKPQITRIQTIAEKVFKVLECEGMARVDMFLSASGLIIVNEINTLPGFTNISMYPKLWEASGILFPKLLDKLIDFALKKQKMKNRLKRSYN